MFCALSCKAGVTWKQDSSSNMFWTYIFPFSFAFPLVPLVHLLLLFFLATGIRVFFQFLWAWSWILRFWKRFNSPSPLQLQKKMTVWKGCSNTASSPWFLYSLLPFFTLPPRFFLFLPFCFSPLLLCFLPYALPLYLVFFLPPLLPLCFSCFYRPKTLCW